MDFDSILDEIGELGRFQVINYALLCFPVFFGAANSLSYVFTAGIPDYRCRVPGCDDTNSLGDFGASWVPVAVPPIETLKSGQPFQPSQCLMYQRVSNILDSCSPGDFSNVTLKCQSWIYTSKERTIVTDWDITCFENQWKLSLVGTLHFAGIVCGSGAFGFLADRFGRKLVFIFCILLMAVTGVAQGLSQNYITFCVFAFLNAVGASGVYPLAFIIGVEMVGRRKREMSGIVLNYFYAVGEAAVGLLAWIWPNWITIQIIVSAPAAIFVVYYWLVPESVRWLMAKQRNKKAYAIIRRAARINKVILSDMVLANFHDSSCVKLDDNSKRNDVDYSEQESDDNEVPENVQLLPMFIASLKSRIMVGRFILIFVIWASNAFVYYGLSLNSINMSGDKYLNFILVCLVEIPGYTMAWIAMNVIGRRWSLAASFFMCAVSCFGAAFVPYDLIWASTILFLLGKMGITSAFGVVYVHTAELLPTIIRSGGVGTASTVARFGAMVAPFVPLLAVYTKSLPLVLFGVTAFISTICALLLPETLGCKLPDTVEEAERIGSSNQTLE